MQKWAASEPEALNKLDGVVCFLESLVLRFALLPHYWQNQIEIKITEKGSEPSEYDKWGDFNFEKAHIMERF